MQTPVFVRFAAGVLFVGGIALGQARAQEATPEAPSATPAPPAADNIEQIPDDQKAERSSSAVSRMKVILSRVLEHLTEAREEKDVVKLNCVNEKLTAVKGLLKISEQADVTLQEALARRDTEISSHEFEKISIAQRKCEQLLAESEACVGELAVYAGETEVEVILEDIPEDDPLNADTSENPNIPESSRLPIASPYL